MERTDRFTRVVPALGIAQIISWGSLYYSIAVLAWPIQRSLSRRQEYFEWTKQVVNGVRESRLAIERAFDEAYRHNRHLSIK